MLMARTAADAAMLNVNFSEAIADFTPQKGFAVAAMVHSV
jgi:hypothetical protein